ncbi:protein Wnt-7b-like isoform X1 [Parasteatoda tepidariorum]|uniref:protein Wnt-7b-like isoform X1 n=1 Tax=Parasteatoda tepidariorum TaxID=114398 RepID=UPI00077FBA7B|nr:protein Wnt-7b-like isoform X1 [Parasteatoda tepidariorum]
MCWLSVFYFIVILSCRAMSWVIAVRAADICNKIPGLTMPQRIFCQTRPDIVVAIGEGTRLGVAECQRQFRYHRWNCSTIGSNQVFGHVIVVGSREAAYMYSVTSAGVTFVITQSCSRGNVSDCGCDKSQSSVKPLNHPTDWKWGGCSVDVKYGIRLSRKFIDAREMEGDARSLMNLHNNHAGRKAVKHNLKTECKCHGVSGSCTMKTCWKTLPAFAQIGDYLMKAYKQSKKVVPHWGPMVTRTPSHLKLKKSKRVHRKPRPRDLVYLENSPNYCEKDLSRGSLGTVGRECNRTSKDIDGCDLLCCGRGYNTHQYIRTWQCNCKFHWCCYVNCDVCRERTENYVCK